MSLNSPKTPKRGGWILPAPKAPLQVIGDFLARPDVWARVSLCVITAGILYFVMSGWAPAFKYRTRLSPSRDVYAHTSFEFLDPEATEDKKDRARSRILCLYENDISDLTKLRSSLVEKIFEIKQKEYDQLEKDLWTKFLGEDFVDSPIEATTESDEPQDPALDQDSAPDNEDSSTAQSRIPQFSGEQASELTVAVELPESHSELTETRLLKSDSNPDQQDPVDEEPASPSEDSEKHPRTEGERAFYQFRSALEKDETLDVVKRVLETAFLDIDKNGLLNTIEHEPADGNMEEIQVFPAGNVDAARRVAIEDVRIAGTYGPLRDNLILEFKKNVGVISDPEIVGERIFTWLKPDLPTTLKWDVNKSKLERRRASDAVVNVMKLYEPGDPLNKKNRGSSGTSVISSRVPLDQADIELLRAEQDAYVKSMTMYDHLLRSVAFFGLFAALFTLFAGYLYYRDRKILVDIRHFSTLLGLLLFTLVAAWVLAISVEWRSEIFPITMFAMTIAIAYHIELSVFLSALVAIAFTVAHGYGLGEFVILTAASSTAALLCRTIRSRTRLVYVGLVTAGVVFPTVVGVQYMMGQPFVGALLLDASWYAGSACFAGLFMAALLPFLESLFDVQTDLSLLELSDANHPLLKELVQRAPGTYNHSINVASISEAAAEAIGASGLLCRVGAYFHDIGKLRKPEYFIENQGGGHNKHDELLPTMSTLVITAHVKEGAEMARTHRLPQRIIDLIEQHHGTTLVEYFYKRAAKQSAEDGDATEVEEKDYRYPGPRPQTREAAVMMLADAVESASRALREPTPGRIDGLVKEIAKKRLDDCQFDECDITIRELNTIQESLIKSLNAMYHARVKYPDQQTA